MSEGSDEVADEPQPLALDQATAATFQAVVGTTFAVDRGGASFRLDRVRLLPDAGQPREQPFALDLSRPGPVLDQGIIRLHHDELGLLEVFCVPVGREGDVVRYEVLFN